MTSKNLISLLLLALTAISIVLIAVVVLSTLEDGKKVVVSSSQGGSQLSITGATYTPLNVSNQANLTPVSAVATKVAVTSTAGNFISVLTPSVGIGEIISAPGYNIANLQLKRTATTAALTHLAALDVVYNKGLAWAKGGDYKGRIVNITATFGIATFGSPGPNGAWLGPQNLPLVKCSSFGQCSSTGTVLNHLENRPVWILEYSNLDSSDYPPPPYACPQCKRHDRTIFAVDVEYGAVIYSWTYASGQ